MVEESDGASFAIGAPHVDRGVGILWGIQTVEQIGDVVQAEFNSMELKAE